MARDLRQSADECFARGNEFDRDGHRADAIGEWQEATQLDPNHAAAHYNLGIAFAEQGDLELAVRELQQAVRLDPLDPDGRRVLAEIYLEQDRFDDGVNQLRQTLNLVPGDSESAHLLAEAYLSRQMWDQAASALEAGAMLEEDADLWYALGVGYEQTRRWEDALLAYRRTLVCRADHSQAIAALARLGAPIEEGPDPDAVDR